MVETDPVAVKMHDCTEEILIEWATAKPWGNLMSRRIRSAGGRDAVEIGRATISERQIVEKMRWFELHGNTPFSLVSIC